MMNPLATRDVRTCRSAGRASRRAVVWIGARLAVVALVAASTRCNQEERRADIGVAPRQARTSRQAPESQPVPTFPLPRTDIANPLDEAEQWLTVEAEREGTKGGWATGSFDPKRNKITIRTNDVERFAVDVARIPIDWKRPVILGIDGRNSELRRRESPLLHFRRGEGRGWVVEE